MRYQPKVYFASKLRHGATWRLIRDHPNYPFEVTCRWIDLEGADVCNTDEVNAVQFWRHDVEDVKRSEVLVLYGEPEDKLRGALVEAGVALAMGHHVIVVGEHPDYGSWQYHPLVSRVATLEDAYQLIEGRWTYGNFALEGPK